MLKIKGGRKVDKIIIFEQPSSDNALTYRDSKDIMPRGMVIVAIGFDEGDVLLINEDMCGEPNHATKEEIICFNRGVYMAKALK